MATSCYGGTRRLSDLLQEQQEEPFLDALRCRSSPLEACSRRLRRLCLCDNNKLFPCGGTGAAAAAALGKALMRKALALRWGDLAGCFPCGEARRQRFRRMRRAGDIGLGDGTQLSPVSVLELHSDDESPGLSDWDEKDDDNPSTSATSPPTSDHDLPGGATLFITHGKIRAVDDGNNNKRLLQEKSGEYSMAEEKEQAIVSGWERIAADISRIPRLVALDLSGGSAREWSGDEEARRVGQSIEAMIFEDVRWEAVRDMHHLPAFLPC